MAETVTMGTSSFLVGCSPRPLFCTLAVPDSSISTTEFRTPSSTVLLNSVVLKEYPRFLDEGDVGELGEVGDFRKELDLELLIESGCGRPGVVDDWGRVDEGKTSRSTSAEKRTVLVVSMGSTA